MSTQALVKRALSVCGVVVLLLVSGLNLVACKAQTKSGGNMTMAQKESALRGLRDNGVLTEQEYEDRLAKLHAVGTTAQRAMSKGNGAGASTWKLKKVEFSTQIGYDAMPQYGIPAWPEKHEVAATILAPADWDTKIGQTNGPPDCNFVTGRIAVISMSPDKKSAFLMLPTRLSVWSDSPMLQQLLQRENQRWGNSYQCAMARPQPLPQRAAEMLHKLDPKIEVVGGVEPIPGLSEKLPGVLQQANANLMQQSRGMGRPSTLQAEAGRVRFVRRDPSDTGEGYLYLLQTLRTDYTPNGPVETVDTPISFVTGAPQGQLEAQQTLFQTMAGSLTLSPEYQAECLQVEANLIRIHQITDERLNQIASEMAADNARTATKIASIQAGVSQYRNQVMSNVAANRSAALEHSSQQFSLYMGDQAQYRDSSGNTVQLPSGAGHVWASATGNTNEYILTNSASYDPNGKVGSAGWAEMQEVR